MAIRYQVSSAATVSDLPDASTASRYTWALTVPNKGIIHRAVMVLTDGAAFGANANMEDACYIHTTCAAGAGKNNTVAGEVSSIVAQFPFSLHHADHMASRIEYERWKTNKKPQPKQKPYKTKPKVSSANSNAADMFKDLFGDS